MKLNFKTDGHSFKLEKGQKCWDVEIFKDDKLVMFSDMEQEENEGLFGTIQRARQILKIAIN